MMEVWSHPQKTIATKVKTSVIVRLLSNLFLKYFSHSAREVSKVFQDLSKRLYHPSAYH